MRTIAILTVLILTSTTQADYMYISYPAKEGEPTSTTVSAILFYNQKTQRPEKFIALRSEVFLNMCWQDNDVRGFYNSPDDFDLSWMVVDDRYDCQAMHDAGRLSIMHATPESIRTNLHPQGIGWGGAYQEGPAIVTFEVPEPSGLTLLALGGLLLAGTRRRNAGGWRGN